jgi:ribosomal subunit interface protein
VLRSLLDPARYVLDLLVPPACVLCRRAGPATAAGGAVCATCRAALPWLRRPRCPRCALPAPCGARCPAERMAFGAAWAPIAYDGPARALVRALKERGALPVAALMAAHIAATAPPGVFEDAVVVPVPAEPWRRRVRGVDHAARLAAEVAARAGVPGARPLRRRAGAPRQAGAGRRARLREGRVAVAVRPRAEVPPIVVLVDDVHTTGATLHACARALRGAGSREVRAVTWARTLPFSRGGSTLGGPPDPSPQEGRMQIEVKGRNTPVSEDVREHVEKRFAKVGKQVSELAVLEVELWEERNPANPDCHVAEVTLHLKGTVLRARDASRDMVHSINLCADELARQVKRDRDKRRRRREARSPGMDGPSTATGDVSPAL